MSKTLEKTSVEPAVLGHGGRVLPAVTVDTYNEELRDAEGFVGDRASGRAFRAILDDCREKLRGQGEDPFGDTPTREISKSRLDAYLAGADPIAAGLVHTAVEEFAQELAIVVRRFLRLKDWAGTERIVIGGGLSSSHMGQLAMGRASVILAGESITVDLKTITNNPDKAGLIGAAQLAPTWVLEGHDAIMAADIGGTNSASASSTSSSRRATFRRPVSGSCFIGATATTSRRATLRSTVWPRWRWS